MENGKIKVWLPTVRVGSGSDVFTRRLANALERHNIATQISWYRPFYELTPFFLMHSRPPIGTDIIFTNSWNGFAFKRAGLPLVVTVHHSGFDSNSHSYRNLIQNIYHRFLIRPFETWSLRAADRVTTVSMFSANSLKDAVALEKVEIIHNWIDTNRFCPKPMNLRPSSRPFRLLYVGKLSPLKGVDLLAPIMRRLGHGFELHIASGSKSRKNVDYPANMHMLGWLNEEELIRAYQECDALLFPTHSEGFGYVALEAMACGKPVIATNSTALPEVVIHGISGMLCAINDVGSFAEACTQLASDPMLCMTMGKAARQRAVEQFSESQIITHYVTLIQRLTGH